MKSVYPVIFTPLHDEKDTVLVEVPDLKILTEGYGMPDAIYMARDAIGLKGIDYEDDGREIPQPSGLNQRKGRSWKRERGTFLWWISTLQSIAVG